MRKSKKKLLPILMIFIATWAYAADLPVIVEAESGVMGSTFTTGTDGNITYVTISPTLGGTNPGSDTRIITYTVSFPDSGTYDLYARFYVGAANADDDSYYYGNGFGVKDITSDNDWVRANQLSGKGYSGENLVVEGGGSSTNKVWVWLNMSKFLDDEAPVTFRVEKDNLTQTFQIAGREDGLLIDKFVFGRSGLYFTGKMLNNGLPGSTTPPGEEPKQEPIAKGNTKFLGCAYGPDSRYNFESYWNQVTPGNGGKWGWVEGKRDEMNWTDLDEAYNFAQKHKFPFKLHTLIWGGQQPNWIAALDSAEQRQEIEEWYAAVAARYANIDYIDVVNEPIHQAPDKPESGNYIKALGGAGGTGWDWVITSFKLARQYFPQSKLLINEYSVTNSDVTTKTYVQIIRLLQKDSLIDGIGIQAHYFSTSNSSAQTLKNLDSLAATGLKVYPSELDIDGLTDGFQVKEYMRLFPLFWEHPAVPGITVWGYRPGMWRSDEKAYLIDENREPRPAMLWLRAYVNGTFVANTSVEVTSESGSNTISEINGTLLLKASVLPENSTLTTVAWTTSNKNIATVNDTGLVTAVGAGTVTISATSLELASTAKGTFEVTVSGGTSVAGATKAAFYVSPNPVVNELRLHNVAGARNIEVLNVMGQKVLTVRNPASGTVNVSALEKGIYFVTVYNLNGEKSSLKFVKK